MWSGCSVHVYLGRRMLLLRRPNEPTIEWHFEQPISLSQGMEAVQSLLLPRSDIHVHLSAALCPPVEVVYPPEITTWRHTVGFAQARSAAHLGVQGAEVHVDVDPGCPSVVAALLGTDREQLLGWTAAHGHCLATLGPLWAGAGWAGSRGQHVAIIEPDCVTVLAQPAAAAPRALSLPSHGSEPSERMLHRMHHALSLEHGKTLTLRFGGARAGKPAGRGVWSRHWELG